MGGGGGGGGGANFNLSTYIIGGRVAVNPNIIGQEIYKIIVHTFPNQCGDPNGHSLCSDIVLPYSLDQPRLLKVSRLCARGDKLGD